MTELLNTPFPEGKTYTIPSRAFERATQPKPYRFGEIVTRENFVSMLIDSFAKSRGKIAIQRAYFQFLRANTGFDYTTTFTNFRDSGGYDCLTRSERDLFSRAYNKVRARRPAAHGMDPEGPYVAKRLREELLLFAIPDLNTDNDAVAVEKLKGMSIEEFMAAVRAHYESLKIAEASG